MFVALRQTWGEDRVFFYDENSVMCSLPAPWTDAVVADVFVTVAAGRCALHVDDLVALTALLSTLAGDNVDEV